MNPCITLQSPILLWLAAVAPLKPAWALQVNRQAHICSALLGWIVFLFCPHSAAGATAETDLAILRSQFLCPPRSAGPAVWWHWVSGNVSQEGITADLEAMSRIGIGGVQIFSVDQGETKGPVAYLSSEWKALVRHALEESHRLGLTVGLHNCEGWSESGGPWVTPAGSMQKVVWTSTDVMGGQTIRLTDLSRPEAILDYYEDIAWMAFPARNAEIVSVPVRVLTSAESNAPVDGSTLAIADLPRPSAGHPQWVTMEFGNSQSFESMQLLLERSLGEQAPLGWELQVSDDGKEFRKGADVLRDGTLGFPRITGRFFRLWMPVPQGNSLGRIRVLTLKLGGPVMDRFEARAGFLSQVAANTFSEKLLPRELTLQRSDLIMLTGSKEWSAPPGRWTILRIGHASTGKTPAPANPETRGLEADKLNRAAIERHFDMGGLGTILRENLGTAGAAFKQVLCDSWEAGCQNWSKTLPTEFRRRRGYDLMPWIPVLTGHPVDSAELTERFLWDFRKTIAELIAENHYGTLQARAQKHTLAFYAEAAPPLADALQCKGRTDVPMGEFWLGGGGSSDTKEAASAAHIYGKGIAAAESFSALGGWNKAPEDLKALGDRQFCMGINQFFLHCSAHQPWIDRRPGMTMGRWGVNFDRGNTWWHLAGPWIAYLSRCQYLLQRGKFIADICYYYGEGSPVALDLKALDPQPPPGFDFDACNAEVLLTKMTLEHGQLVLPSGMRYRVMVLPETDRMSLPVARKLRELVDAGATIVGPRPLKTPSLSGYPESEQELGNIARELWGDCDGQRITIHRFGSGRVIWGQPLSNVVGVKEDFTAANEDLRYIHRRDGDIDIYFISNQSDRTINVPAVFRVEGKASELWHPDSGRCERLAGYTSEVGRTSLPLQLDPRGSVFVMFFPPGMSTAPVAPDECIEKSVPVPGPWAVEFPQSPGVPRIQTSFTRLLSWSDSPEDFIKYFSGTGTYRTEIDVPGDLADRRRVELDLGQVKNFAEVSVNGRDCGVLWKAPWAVDVTSVLKPGRNEIEVRITNLWPNRLIGDLRLPQDQRTTWVGYQHYRANSPLLPSGLLGPVALRIIKQGGETKRVDANP